MSEYWLGFIHGIFFVYCVSVALTLFWGVSLHFGKTRSQRDQTKS
jgi:hypothetical protein